jgi:hypothetical protein
MGLAGIPEPELVCTNTVVELGINCKELMDFVIAEPTSQDSCKMMFSLTPFLEPAVVESNGEMDLQDLFALILRDQAKVWLVFEFESMKLRGVAVTQEIDYPHHANLRVMFLGGEDMTEWQEQLDAEFCEYCVKHGLTNVEVVGRKGFTRSLQPLGYKQAYTVLLKEVQVG